MPAVRQSSFFSETSETFSSGGVEKTNRLLRYPHPALRSINAKITPKEIDDGSISKIANEMLMIMYATGGVGLAAPQVGFNKRLMVYNSTGDKSKWLNEVIIINPTIITFSKRLDLDQEGCLSFPGIDENVLRSEWIKFEALNLKGRKIKKKVAGFEARIFQHEFDHLEGKLFIDRLDRTDREKVQESLDRLVQDFGEGGAL
eukprot:CAMPEP_0194272034 /NCGR_PEP_ID=MMETSP0169-20130528/5695_1 /TAXON_ID=218684 /ORGANISM="Corethron pennatum, Strain L29A3" /LENGTH=201 /DNA_ID=CAMNT_0039014581 /DNA_START=226 /DNA_END=831 /DNA_ORIENTATION=-